MVLKISAWRNGQKSLQIYSLTLPQIIGKYLLTCHLCPGMFAQSIKTGVSKTVGAPTQSCRYCIAGLPIPVREDLPS